MACREELPGAADADPAADCRCLCGSLLARMVEGAVELKCRRCKRTLLVPLSGDDRGIGPAQPGQEMVPVRRAG
jgi:hypothetical protein